MLQQVSGSLSKIFDILTWIHPNMLTTKIGDEKEFKCASIIGNKQTNALLDSDEVHIGIIFLAPGVTFPQHAREAKEICLILSGTPHIGATTQLLEAFEPGNLLNFENAAPRVFMVRNNVIYKTFALTRLKI